MPESLGVHLEEAIEGFGFGGFRVSGLGFGVWGGLGFGV